jgi:hypothetical protein
MTASILNYLEQNKFQLVEFVPTKNSLRRLKIKHKFLQACEVCVTDDMIIVYANNIAGSSEEIFGSELTLKDLKEVLTWLRK